MCATTLPVITKLKTHFTRYSCPDTVISDKGPQFSSHEFAHFSKSWKFNHLTICLGSSKSSRKVEMPSSQNSQTAVERFSFGTSRSPQHMNAFGRRWQWPTRWTTRPTYLKHPKEKSVSLIFRKTENQPCLKLIDECSNTWKRGKNRKPTSRTSSTTETTSSCTGWNPLKTCPSKTTTFFN